MTERRRWRDVSGARFDSARRLAMALWPFAASLAAVALLLASVVVSVRAIRDRERLEVLAHEVRRSADNAAELLQQGKPCLADDAPDTPGCQRKAAADAYVRGLSNDLQTAIARGIAAHDANSSRQLDALRARLGITSVPARTPITAAPRPTTTAPTTTTTTTCPRLPNGKCRP